MKQYHKLNTVPAEVWQKPSYFIAFGLGSGAFPYAPGTVGTLMAIPIYLLLQPLPWWLYTILVIIATVLSMWLCDVLSKEIGVHDHQGMVIDEFIGYWVTMIAAPKGWIWVVMGFVLFRFFDIIKPPPINYIDKYVGGGIGIILDDVVAGLMALIVMQILHIQLY